MSITSLNFLVGLLLVLVIYYILPRRAQNYWLLLVSYAFITTWGWDFSLVLIVLTIANYSLARFMQKTEQSQPRLLWLGIGLNVFALLFFRTANFFLPGLFSLLSTLRSQPYPDALQILLPVGLAFYSLQSISYLVDVYQKRTEAASDLVDFALYLAYFPKLLAGPIERARTFLPQLAQPRIVDNERFTSSITLIIAGLLRKLLLANVLTAMIYWPAFEDPGSYAAPELIGWLLIYGFFLYNDFAGYTSIARGVSGLFGIDLVQNFKQPYFARNMAEFWNSWHISLSHWLRDYIYFPIGRALLRRIPSRKHWINLVTPPMVTMLVSGLWHGFGWNMLLWGGLHGFYQVVGLLTTLRGPVVAPQDRPFWRQVFSMIFVTILVTFAWAPFIMDLPTALAYWRGMFDWSSPLFRFNRILLLAPVAGLTLLLDWLQRHYQDEAFYLRWPRPAQAFLLAGSILLIAILIQTDQADPFVYQGF